MDKKTASGRLLQNRYVNGLTHRAFAQTGFQLVVLINNILLGSALIGNAFNVNGTVLILRRFGNRA
jgi:hypothetical protein